MSYRPRPAAKLPLAAAGCALAALLSTPLVMAQSEAAQSTLQARRVVIDAVTGRPRAPEAGELATAPASAQRSAERGTDASSSGSGIESHPAMKRMLSTPPVARMGTVGNRFNASTLEFTVARREANGTVSTTCVTGHDAATTAMHGETKGERHDH